VESFTRDNFCMKSSQLISIILAIMFFWAVAAYGLNNTVEVKIGGMLWYSWWKPPWSDGLTYAPPGNVLPVSTPYKIKKYETPPAVMYGFMVSAQFLESWIFSSSFMYGNYFSKSSTPDLQVLSAYQRLSFSKDIKKYDFDARLGYQVNKYLSVYLCVSTLSYNYIESMNNVQASASPSIGFSSAKAEFTDAGPGLGVGVSIPLYQDLSLVFDLSGLVLAGAGNYVYRYHYVIGTEITQLLDQFQKESFYSYSGNGSAALEYYIRPAGITLRLGGQYDIIYYRHHRDRILRGFLDYGDKYDRFYGITFATIYSFTLNDDSTVKR
jgi:hypothetical protein